MSEAVRAIIRAFDALKALDGCSAEDKTFGAEKMLHACPTELPFGIAALVVAADPKLKAKLAATHMTMRQRVAYVASCVTNAVAEKNKPKPNAPAAAPEHGKAERDFARNAVAEMRELARESDRSPGMLRRQRAIEQWRDSLGKLPTPHWALQGFDTPDDYEIAKEKRAQRRKETGTT